MSALADAEIVAALEWLGHPELAVVAMGKLGGGELNVSSDIDLVFVRPAGLERAVHPLVLDGEDDRHLRLLGQRGRDGRLGVVGDRVGRALAEGHDLQQADLPLLQRLRANPVVRGCRMIKSAHELKLMQAANDIMLASLRYAAQRTREGMKPADIDAFIAGLILRWRIRRFNWASMDKMQAFDAVAEESNKLLKRFAIYDETMWLYWPSRIEMPTIYPLAGGLFAVVDWIKPRRFCRASTSRSAGAVAAR